MNVSNPSNSRLKAAISVSEMARLVRLSRASFYAYMQRGVFLKPIYCTRTRRPFFTEELQRQNIQVRQTQKGINGEYVLFYERRQQTSDRRAGRRLQSRSNGKDDHLISQLQALGVEATTAKVEQAMAECFPDGTGDADEGAVLRALNRHLRGSNVVRLMR